MTRHRLAFTSWLAWTAFVIYGSLLPFDFRPIELDRAWLLFRQAPFLVLGVESRADWIANGVLYAPVGFLTATLLLRALGPALSGLALALAAVWCATLALGIEFAQLYFPPRTVSLNDLLAECLGSALGIALSPVLSPWLQTLQRVRRHDRQRLGSLLLPAYLLAYPAFCWFPYDILLAPGELQHKLSSASWGWWLAAAGPRPVLAALQLGLELILSLPYGWWLARRGSTDRVGLPAAAAAGGLLGLAIETGQLLIASGISQGASVLARTLGVLFGALLWRQRHRFGLQQLAQGVRRHALPLLLAHGLLLAVVTGWFVRPWQGLASAQAQWHTLRLMPFYYHYYTTEAVALFSLGSVAVMYLPVAAFGWSMRWSAATTGAFAGLLCLVMEASKLFLADTHPDPTNLLIAMVACAAALRGLDGLANAAAPPPAVQHALPAVAPGLPAPNTAEAADAAAATRANGPGRRRGTLVLTTLLGLAALSALRLPTFALPVSLLLLACAVAVWQRPLLALAIVPAALPVFDLAPWTGRFYWDEFDLLCLVCWTVAMHRTRPSRGARPGLDGLTWAFGAVALSLLIGSLRGFVPWQLPDLNSFIGYYGGYNTLRIVKGAVWAWCFVGLFHRLSAEGGTRQRSFAAGMQVGLALTVAVILWERAAFVGWFDFAADYRVTGPFSAMHKGGAYVECYLAVASAFAATAALRARSWAVRLASGGLLLATAYAQMVTFSRNGYAAFALVLVIVFGLGLLTRRWTDHAPSASRPPTAAAAAILLALVLGLAWPIASGDFARERLAQSARDLSVRQDHWADALAQRDPDALTTLLGVGLGRFPESHFWRSQEPRRAAGFQLMGNGDDAYLRLGTGAAIYIEQIVDLPRATDYQVRARIRSNQPGSTQVVTLCQKWMLTSATCASATLAAGPVAGVWQSVVAPLPARALTAQAWFAYRPLKLTLVTPSQNASIEIDDLQLVTKAGTNVLANGDFSAGLDRWFFATDVDPPWHIHSLPVALLFDLGWFGLLAWATLAAVSLVKGLRSAWRGSASALAAVAGVLAFLVSGSLNTLFDAPRFLFLLLVLLWLTGRSGVRRPPPLPAAQGP